VILPLAAMAESEGLFYTLDGQSFATEPAIKAAGQAKPGWKILRRMGTELELDGFSQVSVAALRHEMLSEADNTYYSAVEVELAAPKSGGDLYRVGEVAMYAVDALCRRSDVLQKTVHAETAFVGMSPDDAGSRGLEDGRQVKVSQADGQVTLPLRICKELPVGAVWVKCATDAGKVLGDSFGPISVEAV